MMNSELRRESSRREHQVSERIRRTRKWGSVAAVAGVAVLVTAACSSSGSGPPKSSSSTGTTGKKTVTKIAIAVPAKVSDYGWNQQGVNGATVTVNVQGFGSRTCITNNSGVCQVAVSVADSVASVRFTVTNVTAPGYTYDAAANHDPDGDSNGTRIVVPQP